MESLKQELDSQLFKGKSEARTGQPHWYIKDSLYTSIYNLWGYTHNALLHTKYILNRRMICTRREDISLIFISLLEEVH